MQEAIKFTLTEAIAHLEWLLIAPAVALIAYWYHDTPPKPPCRKK